MIDETVVEEQEEKQVIDEKVVEEPVNMIFRWHRCKMFVFIDFSLFINIHRSIPNFNSCT